MAANDEKESRYRTIVGSTGKRATYVTLNITQRAAKEQISPQKSENEIDEEEKLLGSFASKLPIPAFAYIRRIWFEMSSRTTDYSMGKCAIR